MPRGVRSTQEPEPEPEPEILPGLWRVLSRVTYTVGGDEHIAGAGEIIDGAAAAQVDPAAIEAAG